LNSTNTNNDSNNPDRNSNIKSKDETEEVPVYKQMKDAKYKLQKEINEAKRI